MFAHNLCLSVVTFQYGEHVHVSVAFFMQSSFPLHSIAETALRGKKWSFMSYFILTHDHLAVQLPASKHSVVSIRQVFSNSPHTRC